MIYMLIDTVLNICVYYQKQLIVVDLHVGVLLVRKLMLLLLLLLLLLLW